MIKRYDKDLKKAASIIAAEVVHQGRSLGWTGSDSNYFNQLRAYLANFNIAYVDDFSGEWRYKKFN